jgi:hypothetical protein
MNLWGCPNPGGGISRTLGRCELFRFVSDTDFIYFISAKAVSCMGCSIYISNIGHNDGVPLDLLMPTYSNQMDAEPIERAWANVRPFQPLAHTQACKLRSLGQNAGESPERCWPITGSLSGGPKEMGPELRQDLLIDHHFNDWKSKKIGA